MINLGYIASAAGIGRAGNGPAAAEPAHRPDGAGAGSAGFFGVLFALFASRPAMDVQIIPDGAAPLSDSCPVMPGNTVSPEGTPVSAWDGLVTHGDVIVNAGPHTFGLGVSDLAAPVSREGLPEGVEPVVPGIESSSGGALNGALPEVAGPADGSPAKTHPMFTYPARVKAPTAPSDTEPLIRVIENSSGGDEDGRGPCGGFPAQAATAGTGPKSTYPAQVIAAGDTLAGQAGQTVMEQDITVAEGGDPIPAGSAQLRTLGMRPHPLQEYIDWATDSQPAGRSATSSIPIQGADSVSGDTGRTHHNSPDTSANERPPDHSLESGPELKVPPRHGDHLPGQLFRVRAVGEQVLENQAHGAFARTAAGGAALRPALLGDSGGKVMTLPHGQVDVATDESNAPAAPGTRSHALLSSMTKAASARSVEPLVAPEAVERAFIFASPQETVLPDSENAPPGEALARTVVSRVYDETLSARAAGSNSLSFEITTASGEIVRVRIAMTGNVVSGRIGVMNAESREVLALHIPQLNQRLEMENLVPERFDVYLMNGDGEGERRGGQRKSRTATQDSDEQATGDSLVYFASEPKTFEKWA